MKEDTYKSFFVSLLSWSACEIGPLFIRHETIAAALELCSLLTWRGVLWRGVQMVERVLAAVEVRHVPGIARAFVLEGEDGSGRIRMQTDGISWAGVMAHAHIVDVDRVTTNDIAATLRM